MTTIVTNLVIALMTVTVHTVPVTNTVLEPVWSSGQYNGIITGFRESQRTYWLEQPPVTNYQAIGEVIWQGTGRLREYVGTGAVTPLVDCDQCGGACLLGTATQLYTDDNRRRVLCPLCAAGRFNLLPPGSPVGEVSR